MVRRTYASRLLEMMPPWLQRTRGARLLGGIGDVVDAHALRLSEAVRARYPRATMEDALAYTGRERRFRRGPAEPAATYASRMLRWWDAHRARGSAYEMLRQLHAFFVDSLGDPRIDIVAASGRRHYVAAGGGGVMTRDTITWDPLGIPAEWAHIWVFFYLGASPTYPATLITQAGDTVITHLGDEILVVTDLLGGGTLADEEAEAFCAIPREWSAAHIPYVTVVLLYGDGELWDYPVPMGTWDESATITWDEDTPVVLIAE